MKKLIALVLVITFIGMNCATYEKGEGINLEPGQKPGAKLVIQKKDGQQVKGELIAFKKDSLLLKDSQSGADVTVKVDNIRAIKVVLKSKVMSGGGVGFLAGGLTAFLVNTVTDPGESEVSLGLGFLGGILGFFVGLVVGSFLSEYETIQVEGKTETEIKKNLEKLRKKARVPDFQ